ncbi:Peroxisomal fatty acid beta-oxidation multifunctional protein AIM1 [Capsicum chinense]|nr:Peroxisomal fatty acid beta-oxidation multifunctional protein AIM1 [Capsicum chinense]
MNYLGPIDLILDGNDDGKSRMVALQLGIPAHIMPLLEIVRTEKTSAQAILDLMAVGKAIKKVPVVVGNCTGFAVNRNFFPYSQSVHILDLTGYGVAVAVGKEFGSVFSDRTFKSPLIDLIKSVRNGKNNGKGYYIYEKGRKPRPDFTVLPIIEESRRLTNIMPGGKPIFVTDQEIVEMILFPVVNEACRVLDEGIVVRASDLDVASVLGMSFPSYRGGIVFWADTVGAGRINRSLKKWSELYGNFFKPSRVHLLLRLQLQGHECEDDTKMDLEGSISSFQLAMPSNPSEKQSEEFNPARDEWWNEEVKKKVETKKTAYTKLVKSKDEEEKWVSREEYKVAKKKAKLSIMEAKATAFESLYKGLEEKRGEKRLFMLAKVKERKGRDLDQVMLLNDEGDRGVVLGQLEHSGKCSDFGFCRRFRVEEVSEAIRKMRRGRTTGPDEIPVDFGSSMMGQGCGG